MKHLVSISRAVLGLLLNVHSIFILCQSNMFSKESWVNGSIMAIDAFLLNFRTSASELLWAKLGCFPWGRIIEERERKKFDSVDLQFSILVKSLFPCLSLCSNIIHFWFAYNFRALHLFHLSIKKVSLPKIHIVFVKKKKPHRCFCIIYMHSYSNVVQ